MAARDDDYGGTQSGSVYLFSGSSAGLSGAVTTASATAHIYETTTYSYLGGVYGKLLVEDLDGDGADDLLTSSFSHDGYRSDGGAGLVFYGPITGDVPAGRYDQAVLGDTAGLEVGRFIAYGDVSGDGSGDLALSTVEAGSGDGAVYFFHDF